MSTIEQVALLAKVSVATVSRVINNSAKVSQSTRQRVLDAIEKLNYQPNAIGTFLRKTNTNMVLILLHGVDNPFFAKIVSGIEKAAHAVNYNILICNTYTNTDRELQYLKMVTSHYLDGAILLSSTLTSTQLNELYKHYPIIQVLEYDPEASVPYVSIDFYQASCELMEDLVAHGHQYIAYIHAGSTHIISHKEKYRAYMDILHKYHLPIITNDIDDMEFSYDNGKWLTLKTLQSYPQTTAFFASSDLLASGVIDACNQLNYQVPQDIAVVGFDNTIYSIINKPTITSVDLHTEKLGNIAMEHLLMQIKNPKDKTGLEYLEFYNIIKRDSS